MAMSPKHSKRRSTTSCVLPATGWLGLLSLSPIINGATLSHIEEEWKDHKNPLKAFSDAQPKEVSEYSKAENAGNSAEVGDSSELFVQKLRQFAESNRGEEVGQKRSANAESGMVEFEKATEGDKVIIPVGKKSR